MKLMETLMDAIRAEQENEDMGVAHGDEYVMRARARRERDERYCQAVNAAPGASTNTYTPGPRQAEAELPDDNPKTAVGTLKPQTHAIPPVAILELGEVMRGGEGEYGLFNWRMKRVSHSTYHDAAMRHLLAMQDGEWFDRKSNRPHAAHIMGCMAVLLDADDRRALNADLYDGPKGGASEFIENNMRKPTNGDE